MADPTDEPRETDAAGRDAYALDRDEVVAILEAVEAQDRAALIAMLEPLHPADIADLLEQIDASERAALLTLYGAEFDGDILSELDESIREEVIALLPPEVLKDAVRDLDSDDVVDLLEDLETTHHDAILDHLEAGDRVAVQQSLSYPEFSAGRLMQREVVMAPEHWNVGEAIDYLRNHTDLPQQFYHIILVDPRLRPVGNVTLGKLMASRREVLLKSLVEDEFRVIPVDQDEEDVAYAFNQYHLISAPVVDEDERLVGMITIDDAMAVLDEEHEEDILRLAGVGESSISDRVFATMRSRVPWLAVSLLTGNIVILVISQFEASIQKIVALAVLMPIVASMGGNAGTQSMAVTVRAIATRDLTGSNIWRVIRREVSVGVLNGAIFAALMGIIGFVLFGSVALGGVVAAALMINLVIAALAGTVIPVLLERFGIDPALASGPFVTTTTDIVGFFTFLGLATLVLL